MTVRVLEGDALEVLRGLPAESVLIELSPKYCRLAEQRVANARARRLLGDVTDKPAPLPGQLGLFDPA